ncbi:MAG: metallophosphoesterase [Lachnospiraceae bacterium]|nr:metallophosphoesterase [Lachnospiraceae bacterium]
MRVLVVSDTHRRNDNYFKVLEKEKNLDLIIHCGDSEGSEYALSESADCPVQLVTGNNDFFSSLPRELEIEIEGYKVWVTHGHNYYVNMGDEFIKEEARARGVDIVMYGHTHRPVINESKGVIAINPGSLTYPRQEGRKPTYIIMEVEKKEVGKKPTFSVCHV